MCAPCTLAVPLVGYLGLFLSEPEKNLKKWTKVQENNDDASHPRDYIDRQYAPRKEEGKRLAIIEDSVDASM